MRFAASSTDDQRRLMRVAPRVFLIRDGKLLDRHRQGEQRRGARTRPSTSDP